MLCIKNLQMDKSKRNLIITHLAEKLYRNSNPFNAYTAGYSVFHVLDRRRNTSEEAWIATKRKHGGRHGGVEADIFIFWKI